MRRLFQAAIKPTKPQHIGEAMHSPLKPEWIECLFDTYDKMHRTGSFSRPFLRIKLPPDTRIINPRITFEVKITDIPTFYELKCRFCGNGSIMIEGPDYDLSFASVVDGPHLFFMIAISTAENMVLYFVDISNAFQTNVIEGPNKRHFLALPPL